MTKTLSCFLWRISWVLNDLSFSRQRESVNQSLLPCGSIFWWTHWRSVQKDKHSLLFFKNKHFKNVRNESAFHSKAPSLSSVRQSFSNALLAHRQEHCAHVWKAPLGLVMAHYESEITSKPNIFRDERGPVSLTRENKPLALWEIHQKPPFRNVIPALSWGCLTMRCDLIRQVEYHKYNNWTKEPEQLHWCHSNKMPRKARRHMHSPIHSPSLPASGDSGWTLFDDALSLQIIFSVSVVAKSFCSLDWWCSCSVRDAAMKRLLCSWSAACERLMEGRVDTKLV